MGKGSGRRPTNEQAFQHNYDAIFGKKAKNEQKTLDERNFLDKVSVGTDKSVQKQPPAEMPGGFLLSASPKTHHSHTVPVD